MPAIMMATGDVEMMTVVVGFISVSFYDSNLTNHFQNTGTNFPPFFPKFITVLGTL